MQRQRGRPRQFDREAALGAAMRLFWERGYEGTSIDDLTSAMGIKRPSLYAGFGCKEALFREAVELYSEREGEPIAAAMRDAPDTRSAVEALLSVNANAYCSDANPAGCMIVLSALAGTPQSEDVRQYLAEIRKSDQASLEDRLRKGVDAGELGADADIAAMARFYTAMLQGLSVQARDGAKFEQLQDIIRLAMSVWPLKKGKGKLRAR